MLAPHSARNETPRAQSAMACCCSRVRVLCDLPDFQTNSNVTSIYLSGLCGMDCTSGDSLYHGRELLPDQVPGLVGCVQWRPVVEVRTHPAMLLGAHYVPRLHASSLPAGGVQRAR